MDEDDEIVLKQINTKLPAGQPPISEDHFEEVMNFFEETAQARQPFAAVDSPPVLPLEELQEFFDDTHPDYVRTLSTLVYSHWSTRRTNDGNHGLAFHLKFETGQESDDSDPYVCFRRRELRQIRKTRNRDAQSAEKLRKLRLELESARNVLLMVKRREQMRREVLELDRQIFEQRVSFRETKRKLGMKGDEELLVNQKKQKLPQGMSPNQAALAQQLRIPIGAGGPGMELRTLEDVLADKQRSINHEIQMNIEKHIRWNEGYVDMTRFPLTPPSEDGSDDHVGVYRRAMAITDYPTPPASNDEEDVQKGEVPEVVMKEVSRSSTPFGYVSPVEDGPSRQFSSYRRRIGRGGRVIVDRKVPRRKGAPVEDRWKYDSDHSDIEDTEDATEDRTFEHIVLRANLYSTSRQQDAAAMQKRAQLEAAQGSNHPAQQSAHA
jgi:enhancer of polycomb-like protein